MDVKYGEVCSSCGHTQRHGFQAGLRLQATQKVYFFYLSKADPGKWKSCDEVFCRQMASIGFKVKKVVQ